MFIKLNEPRKFNYRVKYYTPPPEDDKRIKFKRVRHSPPAKKSSVLRLVLVCVVLIFMIFYLQKKAGRSPSGQPKMEKFIVEDVIVVE